MHSFEARLMRKNSNLWDHYVPVPEEISAYYKKKVKGRVVATLNEKIDIHCAIMAGGKDSDFVMLNKEVRTKLKVAEGDLISVKVVEDTSKYGMEVSEEFAEFLHEDPEFNEYFHALTIGKQRNLIYISGQPKTSDTRIRRCLAISEHLKLNRGKLDFKALYQSLKA